MYIVRADVIVSVINTVIIRIQGWYHSYSYCLILTVIVNTNSYRYSSGYKYSYNKS